MVLALNSLRSPAKSRRSKKRLGRGNASGHGTYSTRGLKGQRARQGGRKGLGQLGVKHFVARLPKVRGFKSLQKSFATVTIDRLATFPDGTVVDYSFLKSKRLVRGPVRPLKLIGNTKLTVKLKVKVQAVSKGAQAVVEAAGGQVEIVAVK
ncbi:50S ribosomal protein L15 [Patescibacteria group bacterium]|nr:50S ribosomal protein L15 [Patescibacteria group bacterium]